MTSAPLTLYTFAMSHFSEKIRWTLDACQLPYEERCLTPVFHMPTALRLGRRGQTTLPIVQQGSVAVQDSPRIVDWLETCQGTLSILPQAQREAIRQIEQRFDSIGKDVARLLYAGSFGVADGHIRQLWTAHANPLQTLFIRLAYPLICLGFRRKLNINAASAARASERIGAQLDWLEAQLADGRRYLVGDQLSLADITAASLLAPIACPAEHPVYGDAAYQAGMAATLAPWQARPGMAWVRELYRQQRHTRLTD
ncbi:glutathione S-transferase family protein [Pseudomonas sp. HAR-UPW-AIA-41]|uniref:glutathione S-transferase family protein n=1 Tax=Pseudomonas sp. HAR-UPW-AIA-41 TaxID=1985301 RepID=UPI001596D948|nr:glutathione S-transferase [Pseudomonas sp. HAR-UPW-AIA-41]